MTISAVTLNKYHKQYAGAYAVTPDGAEVFKLKDDGTATWSYSGQLKKGTWDAVVDAIWIKINGNTGLISEKYNRLNGRFISDEDNSRRLVKQ